MLRERAANEKARYLRELEEWTKKGNKEIELQSAFESYHFGREPKQEAFRCMERSGTSSESGNDFHGHLMDRRLNQLNATQLVWPHE